MVLLVSSIKIGGAVAAIGGIGVFNHGAAVLTAAFTISFQLYLLYFFHMIECININFVFKVFITVLTRAGVML